MNSIPYISKTHDVTQIINFNSEDEQSKEIVELAVRNFGFLIKAGSPASPAILTFKELASLIKKNVDSEQAKQCTEALERAYYSAMPKSVSLAECVKKGGLTHPEAEGIAALGFYHEYAPLVGEKAMSNEIFASNEFYFDFMRYEKYAEATDAHDFKELGIRFTFDWEQAITYVTLGENEGDGFDEYLTVKKADKPLKDEVTNKVEALADDEYFKSIIKSNPKAYGALLDAIDAIDKHVCI